jgi:hypothetical protein
MEYGAFEDAAPEYDGAEDSTRGYGGRPEYGAPEYGDVGYGAQDLRGLLARPRLRPRVGR